MIGSQAGGRMSAGLAEEGEAALRGGHGGGLEGFLGYSRWAEKDPEVEDVDTPTMVRI